ncbi:D-alanyl-D-alanine carboxypeptidase family protein [Patescibacteria group bacterium]
MTYTIFQKFIVLIIRLFIAPLWFLDTLAGYTSKNKVAGTIFNLSLLFFLTTLIIVPFKDREYTGSFKNRSSLLHTGIVSEIYGVPLAPEDVSSSANVLGSSSNTGKVKNPVLVNKRAFPFITAKAHLVIDNKSKKIFSEHNTSVTFAPASTTKLITALVSTELYSENEILTATDECAAVESTKLWLPVGSQYTVKDLVYSLLINSAGDAGCILASSKVSQEDFIELMNKKAKELGLEDTNFTNPVGLDGVDGSNYSSVWDLYLLSNKIMENNMLRGIVKTRTYSFTDISEELNVNLENTNKLLWDIPETVGVKTGRTTGAGEVLIYRYDDGEKDITIIVMSSEDRFLDTQDLLKWTLSSYKWM